MLSGDIYHCTEWLNTLISVLWPNLARFIIIPKMVSPVLCSFLAERSGFFDTIWANILQHDHITTYDPSSTFNDDWHNSFLATLLTKFYEKKQMMKNDTQQSTEDEQTTGIKAKVHAKRTQRFHRQSRSITENQQNLIIYSTIRNKLAYRNDAQYWNKPYKFCIINFSLPTYCNSTIHLQYN